MLENIIHPDLSNWKVPILVLGLLMIVGALIATDLVAQWCWVVSLGGLAVVLFATTIP